MAKYEKVQLFCEYPLYVNPSSSIDINANCVEVPIVVMVSELETLAHSVVLISALYIPPPIAVLYGVLQIQTYFGLKPKVTFLFELAGIVTVPVAVFVPQ